MSALTIARPTLIVTLVLLLVVACMAGLMLGPYPLGMDVIVAILCNRLGIPTPVETTAQQTAVLWSIRLPRVLLAVVTGAGLAVAGGVMQGLFRNPLADPGLLGVTSGAALGAALAIVVGVALPMSAFAAEVLLPLSAFSMSLLVTVTVYRLSRSHGTLSLAVLLLSGIAVNAMAGALIGLLSYLSTDEQLRDLTFWNLGSLARASWPAVAWAYAAVLPSSLLLLRLAAPLNCLLLGEADARHLGVDLERIKNQGILLSAVVVGSLVAACGMIGFISLVAPHLIRLLFGPDHHAVLPGSAICGALLLVLADLAARTLAAPAEVPIGIVTALMGAPVFVWLLKNYLQSGGAKG